MSDLYCVLADDEPLALELLGSLLQSIPEVKVVAMCSDGTQALHAIQKQHPDIAFLDIEMPGLSGFDVVRRLQPETMPAIVFTTAFEQYAIDAFEVHAVDYLLKPLRADRLYTAVQRAKVRLAGFQNMAAGNKASILSAIDQLAGSSRAEEFFMPTGHEASEWVSRKLLVRDTGKTHVIDPCEIDWVDAAGDYMCIHVGGETLVARTTMKKLARQLDTSSFTRIHRSTMVNVSKIREIENLGKGDCLLHLAGGVTLKASRNYRERLAELLA